MDPTALIIEAFGVGSLTLAFAKYTIERRKTMNAKDNMKNHGLKHSLNNRHM